MATVISKAPDPQRPKTPFWNLQYQANKQTFRIWGINNILGSVAVIESNK